MHENEILVILLASCVLMFVFSYRRQLLLLPAHKLLIASFLCAWVAWIATVVEHLALPKIFNIIEHVGYCLNGALLLTWCWLVMRNKDKSIQDD